MADIRQQVAQARKAGYSDAEIVAFLGKTDPRVSKAKQSGYKDAEIVGFLSVPSKAIRTKSKPTYVDQVAKAFEGGADTGMLGASINAPELAAATGNSVLSGALWGGKNELRSLPSGAAGFLAGGKESALREFDKTLQRLDAQDHARDQAYPKTTAAAKLAGALIPVPKLGLATGLGARAGAGAATGAVGGFVGTDGTTADRALGAGIGGALGTVLGGALGGKAGSKAATAPKTAKQVLNAEGVYNLETLNRAAANRALAAAGLGELPKGVKPGHEAVAYVQDALGRGYEAVLPKLTLKADDQFAARLADIEDELADLPGGVKEAFEDIMKRRVQFSDGVMDGATLKAARANLESLASKYRKSADPFHWELANALGDMKQELMSLAERSSPQHAGELRKLNSGWSLFAPVQRASSRAATNARDGMFTPQELGSAVRAGDPRRNKGASARGEAVMQDLAKAAQTALPKERSAGEVFRMVAPTIGAGALTGHVAGGWPGMMIGSALAAAAAAPYTRAGAKAINSAQRAGTKAGSGAASALEAAGKNATVRQLAPKAAAAAGGRAATPIIELESGQYAGQTVYRAPDGSTFIAP